MLCERMSEKVWIDLVSEYSRTRSRDHHVHFAPVVTFTVSILKQVFARPAHPFLSESIRPAYWTHIDLLDCKHLGDSRAENVQKLREDRCVMNDSSPGSKLHFRAVLGNFFSGGGKFSWSAFLAFRCSSSSHSQRSALTN